MIGDARRVESESWWNLLGLPRILNTGLIT